MSRTSGMARELASPRSGLKFSNLTEFRGTIVDALTDYFFGYNSVDYDWNAAPVVDKWLYTAAHNMVSDIVLHPDDHRIEIIGASGDADGLGNMRELITIPETATWGVAHALCEIYGPPRFLPGNTPDEGGLVIKPQHGIGLRAQEDSKRRTMIAWHDINFGLPQSINLGVWSGNPDGSGFLNRQISMAMDLDESYVPTACSQVCDDDAGLVFDGTAANWTTPDHADYEVAGGDWSVKIDVTVADWTPSAQNSFFSKYVTTSNQRAYRMFLSSTGQVVVTASADGTSTLSTFTMDSVGRDIVAALPNGSRRTILMNYTANSGGNRSITWWLGQSWIGPWQQLGGPVNIAGTSTIFSGTAPFELGAANNGALERLTGRIHQFQFRRSLCDLDGNQAGEPFIDIRAQKLTNGATAFTDVTGRAWTRTGTAAAENTTPPVGTVTIGTHSLRVGDRVSVNVGDELNITGLQRTGGENCQCTLPSGHSIETGSYIRILFASETSFNGNFAVNVSGDIATWTDAGADMAGHTGLLWDLTYDRATIPITNVTATTIEYETFGKTKAVIPMDAFSSVFREFPYKMEMRVAATTAMVRCWGRHQTVPDWLDQDRALIADLSKPVRAFTVTNRQRTAGVATLTIGAHDIYVGERITMTSIPDSSFNASIRVVTEITATTFSYINAGSDVGSTASSGTATAQGSGSTQAVIDANPTPLGSGRVAFADAHIGTNPLASARYGDFYGDNSFESRIVEVLSVIETETANPITRAISAIEEDVNQATEVETATVVGRSKVRLVASAVETETADFILPAKRLTVGQAVEVETSTVVGRTKIRAAEQAVETETATTTGRTKVRTAAQAVEAETATTVGRIKVRLAATAVETETATVTGRAKLRAVGQALEAETAMVVGRTKLRAVAQAIEVETADPFLFVAQTIAGQAVETEVAQLITGRKIRAMGQATEAEVANQVRPAHARTLAQVVEVETATTIGKTKIGLAAQAVETETAGVIIVRGVMRQVIETETAGAITASKVRALAQAVETETATVVGRTKTRLVVSAIEVESAKVITLRGVVRQAIELETAQPITGRKIRSLLQAVETEVAQQVRPGHLLTVGQSIELESATAAHGTKIGVVLTAVESESALVIVRFILQVDPPSGASTGSPNYERQTHSRHGARPMVTSGRVRVI